jgi:hypothetical protein
VRLIDAGSLVALGGSRPADSLTVWAWRGGSLVVPDPLDVISWSADDDAGESVKVGQKLSLTVADPDGSLGAWRFDDPLSVAGTELQVIYRVGGAGAVNFGWFRVIGNEPSTAVDSRLVSEYGLDVPDSLTEPHKRRKYVTTGVVKLEAVDRTFSVDRDKLEAPQSPQGGNATVLSEIVRLTDGHFPVVVDVGVVDTPVPSKLVFDRERLEAVQDLATRVNARYRMGGDGECHIYPVLGSTVLRIEPENSLVSVARKQSIDGLYNKWIVEGKDSGNGAPVRGSAFIESGPLWWGGPHGKAAAFYSSEMITDQQQALNYALVLRDQFLASLAVELSVETIPRPELQAGDRVEVGCPVAAGHVAYFPGTITSIRRSGTTVPAGTSMTVTCSYSDVLNALGRTEWAGDLKRTMPGLTWDRMPGSWGTLPALTWNNLP